MTRDESDNHGNKQQATSNKQQGSTMAPNEAMCSALPTRTQKHHHKTFVFRISSDSLSSASPVILGQDGSNLNAHGSGV